MDKLARKNAKFYFDTVYGTIEQNEETGIYGTYSEDYNSKELVEVGSIDEIELGEAYIKTTLDNNKVENFNIEIFKHRQRK